jgi:hypothetical protein
MKKAAQAAFFIELFLNSAHAPIRRAGACGP